MSELEKTTMFDKCTVPLNESYYRDSATERLEEYQAQAGGNRLAELIDRLDGCHAYFRCTSGACPECIDAERRWAVEMGEGLDASIRRDESCSTLRMSLAPDFGRVGTPELSSFDIEQFRTRVENVLHEAGVEDYLLTIGVGHNRSVHDPDSGAFQFRLWGVFKEPVVEWRERLKKSVNQTGSIRFPLVIHQHRTLRATIACGMNSCFRSRVSFVRPGWGRQTHNAPLEGMLLISLLSFLDSIPLQSRVLQSASCAAPCGRSAA
jgi:hypothetical protein